MIKKPKISFSCFRAFVVFVVFVVLPLTTHHSPLTASSAGRDTAQFLKFNPDPKTAATGNTSFSNQPVNNPAGLANIYRPELMLSHTIWVEDIHHSYLSYNSPFDFGNLGFGLTYLGYGEIRGIDMNVNEYSLPASYDTAFSISYAKTISRTVPVYKEWGCVGINLKFIKSSLAGYSAEAFASDFGTILNLGKLTDLEKIAPLKASLVYKNLGSKLKFVEKEYPLPTSFNLALGYKLPTLKNLNIITDFTSPRYSNPVYSVGLCLDPVYFLTLRTGYKYSKDSVSTGITAGFGLNLGSFELNYALQQFKEFSTISELGLTHQVSVQLALGGFKSDALGSDYYLRRHLNKAYELYYQKDYNLAKQQLETIISLYPDYSPATQLLQKTDASIEKMNQKKEQRIANLLKKAKISTDRNDCISAERDYQTVIQLDPDNTDAKQGLENVHQELAKIKQAQINQQNAKNLTKLWNEAEKYYKKGEFVKSKDKFNRILTIDPQHSETKKYLTEIDVKIAQLNAQQINELYLHATEMFKKEKYEEAMKYFESIVTAAPHRLDAKEFLDKCTQKIQELQEKKIQEELATQQKEKKEEMDKTFKKALKLYEKSDYLHALEWFEKSKEVAEKYQFNEYLEKSRLNIETIKLVIADLYYKEGYKLYQQNKLEDAYEQYFKSLQYNSNNITLGSEITKLKDQLSQKYYEIGISHYTRGESEKAKKYFEKSLSYNPSKDETLRALERIK